MLWRDNELTGPLRPPKTHVNYLHDHEKTHYLLLADLDGLHFSVKTDSLLICCDLSIVSANFILLSFWWWSGKPLRQNSHSYIRR